MEEAFEPEVPEVETELPDSVFFILSDPAPLTRVTYAGDGLHADFEKEDLVGCFALNYDQESKIFTAAEGEGFKPNSCYRVSVHTNITTGEDRRFLSPVTAEDDINKTADRYLFYYPYDSEITSLDKLKAYGHSVNTDQNDRDRYEASDLLWDICTPDDELKAVYVEMDHAMAQIIVEVESGLIKEGTVPTLLNIPITVSKLDLVKPDLATMTEDMKDPGLQSYVLDSESKGDITMWEFGYATSGNLMFRAAVPANHTMPSGSLAIQITKPDGTPAKYRLSKALNFEPGKNYLMTLVSRTDVVAPEITDEDSWVLDVLDPETREPVGLLCREYIRFQPGTSSRTEPDYITGDLYNEGATKYISSQAWVFYKMDGKYPDLDEGTVLRFIYDVRANVKDSRDFVDGNWKTSWFWPAPHVQKGERTIGGLFTPEHGHDWVLSTDGNNGVSAVDGVIYRDQNNGKELDPYKHKEHNMHGGVLEWDGDQNIIKTFTLPANPVTNKIAKDNGHIAIPSDRPPFVSYSALDPNDPTVDEDGYKVGLLTQHYLIDRRIGKQRRAEERMYPLVKIGYNQFWMTYSLRAATLSDGTPISNYNSETVGNVLFGSSDDLSPSFLYSSATCDDGQIFNPYHTMDITERERYKISVLYNYACVMSEYFLPVSRSGNSHYYMPSKTDVENMLNYLGWFGVAKIMTRRVRTLHNNNWAAGTSEYNSFLNGEYCTTTYNNYTANICGFDLRADGGYYGEAFETPGRNAKLWLCGTNNDNTDPVLLAFNDYEVFTPNISTGIFETTYRDHGDKTYRNRAFYPVRFFMKFDGQADTGGGVSVSSVAKGLATKASSAPVDSRDVYVGLELVEEEL